jgi:DNA-directed RNA polymerase subunit K/omega
VIRRPPGVGAFQFVVMATLRAGQLIRGCRPRVDGAHKAIVTAQLEVSEGKVTQLLDEPVLIGEAAVDNGAPVEYQAIPAVQTT